MKTEEQDQKAERQKLADLANDLPRQFSLILTKEFKEQLQKIRDDGSKPHLIWQVKAAIIKLAHNPKYPGLNSHIFDSFSRHYGREVWESYVQNRTPGAYRLFWHYGPGKKDITLVMVTPHP